MAVGVWFQLFKARAKGRQRGRKEGGGREEGREGLVSGADKEMDSNRGHYSNKKSPYPSWTDRERSLRHIFPPSFSWVQLFLFFWSFSSSFPSPPPPQCRVGWKAKNEEGKGGGGKADMGIAQQCNKAAGRVIRIRRNSLFLLYIQSLT